MIQESEQKRRSFDFLLIISQLFLVKTILPLNYSSPSAVGASIRCGISFLPSSPCVETIAKHSNKELGAQCSEPRKSERIGWFNITISEHGMPMVPLHPPLTKKFMSSSITQAPEAYLHFWYPVVVKLTKPNTRSFSQTRPTLSVANFRMLFFL